MALWLERHEGRRAEKGGGRPGNRRWALRTLAGGGGGIHTKAWGLPWRGSLVAKTPCFLGRACGFDPWSGN